MNKKNIIVCTGIALTLLLSSCIKQLDKTFQGTTVAELDAAPLNSFASGLTYPILTRQPVFGRPIATSDSTIRRISGTVRVRVNLVGAQASTDQTVGYRIFNSPITSIAFPATVTGQTPGAASGTLAVTDAVSGTHFAPLSGKVTIPAKSSFGFIDVVLLPGTAAAGQARFIGITLDSTGNVLPSINYRSLGLVIDQR